MSKTSLQPLQGYCLIELLKENEQTPSGLIKPDIAQERQAKGTILKLGKAPQVVIGGNVVDNLWEVEKGSVVWFKRFAGEEITDQGNKYLLVPQSALLGVYQ